MFGEEGEDLDAFTYLEEVMGIIEEVCVFFMGIQTRNLVLQTNHPWSNKGVLPLFNFKAYLS